MKCKQLTGKLFTTVYDKGCACMRVRARGFVCVFMGKGGGGGLLFQLHRQGLVL